MSIQQMQAIAARLKVPRPLGTETAWWCPSLDLVGRGTATLTDLVGTYDGTLTMDPANDWVQDTTFQGRWAIDFDGINDKIVTAAIDLTGTSTVAISCWLKLPFNDTDDLGFEFSTNVNNFTDGFMFDPNASTSDIGIVIKGNAGYNNANYTRPSDDTWHHYVVIFDKTQAANEIDLWIDNVLQTPTSRPNTNNNGNAFGNYPLYIMHRGSGSLYCAGRIDDVRLFTSVPSSGDIALLSSRRGYQS